ncbi:hypothetical protein [Streptomyces sp. bgisy032]|uniref:hypothetical protein n=1 Tax=Streptomyces sp. bgisy032 TaxID=3413773 RepID=UPI003D75CFC0
MAERGGSSAKGGEMKPSGRFRPRDGFWIAGGVALVGAALALLLLVVGPSKSVARDTLPQLVDFAGGSWVVGAALGLITLLGAVGFLRSAVQSPPADSSRVVLAGRALGTAFYSAAAFGPLLYLLSGLPGKNCRSSSCAYLPGTGTAFLSYAVTAGATGWLLYRWRNARAAEEAARERERGRRLRKKRKGRSRTARGR